MSPWFWAGVMFAVILSAGVVVGFVAGALIARGTMPKTSTSYERDAASDDVAA